MFRLVVIKSNGFFKYFVTDDDVGNIETCLQIKTCRNLFKNYDLLSADSTFWFYYILVQKVQVSEKGLKKQLCMSLKFHSASCVTVLL